jgi:hypothetical protein
MMNKPYGYLIDSGYKGWIGDRYMLFPTEQEYLDYISDQKAEDD